MSPVSPAAVAVRRFLVRRPWAYWLVVVLAALGAAAATLERSERIDAARAAWGRTRVVWVAASDHAPGDPFDARRREVPVAAVGGDVVEDVDGLTARHDVTRGEILYASDAIAPTGPLAMTPIGWLVVPIRESPPSGALIGARAVAVADGVVIADDVLVVGRHDDVTLIAVPAGAAPLVPAAADARGLTLLLVP